MLTTEYGNGKGLEYVVLTVVFGVMWMGLIGIIFLASSVLESDVHKCYG